MAPLGTKIFAAPYTSFTEGCGGGEKIYLTILRDRHIFQLLFLQLFFCVFIVQMILNSKLLIVVFQKQYNFKLLSFTKIISFYFYQQQIR